MKKSIISRIATFVSLVIILTSVYVIPVQAVDNTNTYDLSTIETMAKNTPQFILGSDECDKQGLSDVSVVDCKPLYDFNDKLVAYSIDLKSNTNSEKAFAIISTSEDDGPILAFAAGGYSPYNKITDKNQTCIFDGIQGYYSYDTSSNKYKDIVSNNYLEDSYVEACKANSKNKKYVSKKPDIAKKNRAYLSQDLTKDSIDEKSSTTSIDPLAIVGLELPVPDYEWYKGCAPTSAAMILKYLYGQDDDELEDVTPDDLIEELAVAMDTDSTGLTKNANIDDGIDEVMSSYDVSVSPYMEYDPSNMTFDDVVQHINDRNPFVLCLVGSTVTAPGYPTGYGDHAVATIGYNKRNGSYIVIHDTHCNGDVYCDFNSSALGVGVFIMVN